MQGTPVKSCMTTRAGVGRTRVPLGPFYAGMLALLPWLAAPYAHVFALDPPPGEDPVAFVTALAATVFHVIAPNDVSAVQTAELSNNVPAAGFSRRKTPFASVGATSENPNARNPPASACACTLHARLLSTNRASRPSRSHDT